MGEILTAACAQNTPTAEKIARQAASGLLLRYLVPMSNAYKKENPPQNILSQLKNIRHWGKMSSGLKPPNTPGWMILSNGQPAVHLEGMLDSPAISEVSEVFKSELALFPPSVSVKMIFRSD